MDDTIESLTRSFRETLRLTDHVPRVLTKDATAQETLKRYLSSGIVVPTTSSSAQKLHSAQPSVHAHPFGEIGRGSYGIIFNRPGTLEIVKRPINPRDPPDNIYNLWNDFLMHTLIYESFSAVSYGKIHIPRPLQFISADDDEWWSIWRSRFDGPHKTATNLLFAERIHPVPRPVREALVDRFSPEQFRSAAKASSKNKNCLIHPLLGRRKGQHTLRGMLNLRNFELCVDQMEDLGLDIGHLIDTMAESLALLHFQAHVDAHDIEFVLGAAPTAMHNTPPLFGDLEKLAANSSVKPCGEGMNLHGRAVHLWMLDFNRVSRIPGPDAFVAMALKGFVDQSKAYYPRPRCVADESNDNRNWVRFKAAYTRVAGLVGGDGAMELAARFLRAVEEHYNTAASGK